MWMISWIYENLDRFAAGGNVWRCSQEWSVQEVWHLELQCWDLMDIRRTPCSCSLRHGGPSMARYRYGMHTIVACPGRLNDFLEGGQVRLDGVWSPVARKRTSAKLVPVHALKLIYHDTFAFAWHRLMGHLSGLLPSDGQMISGTSIFGYDLKFHARNAWKDGSNKQTSHKGMPWTNRSQVSCLVLDEADRMLDMGWCLNRAGGFVVSLLCMVVSPPQSEGFEIVWISFLCKYDIMNESIHLRWDDQSSQTQISLISLNDHGPWHRSCPSSGFEPQIRKILARTVTILPQLRLKKNRQRPGSHAIDILCSSLRHGHERRSQSEKLMAPKL